MKNTLTSQIRNQLARYVAGKMTLDAFQEWLSPLIWEVDSVADLESQRLLHLIDHRIVEYTSGAWNEVELKQCLVEILSERPAEASNTTMPAVVLAGRAISSSANVAAPRVGFVFAGDAITSLA